MKKKKKEVLAKCRQADRHLPGHPAKLLSTLIIHSALLTAILHVSVISELFTKLR